MLTRAAAVLARAAAVLARAAAVLLKAAAVLTGAVALLYPLTASTSAGADIGTESARVTHRLSSRSAEPVGALFLSSRGRLGRHFCTASVVPSPAGNLLITAAHCMTGQALSPHGRVVFAPGYSRGRFPRGVWVVTRMFVTARWAARHDPDDDVAFLIVGGQARRTRRATPASRPRLAGRVAQAGDSVEQVAGAERLALHARLPAWIHAVGYPDARSGPVSCSVRAFAYRIGALDQIKFSCRGFTDGTSGGPLLSDVSKMSGVGAIIGVVGGYQQGGDSANVSYSAELAAGIAALYRRAARLR